MGFNNVKWIVLILALIMLYNAATSYKVDCPNEIRLKETMAKELSKAVAFDTNTLVIPGASLKVDDKYWLSIPFATNCKRGSLEGQNLNYHYCSDRNMASYGFALSGKEYDTSGKILKHEKLWIENIVFDRQNTKIVSMECFKRNTHDFIDDK